MNSFGTKRHRSDSCSSSDKENEYDCCSPKIYLKRVKIEMFDDLYIECKLGSKTILLVFIVCFFLL